MRFIYLGFSVPVEEEGVIYLDRRPAIQTLNFSRSLMSVVKKLDSKFVNIYSYPVQNYNKNPCFGVLGKKSLGRYRLGFVNFLVFKHFTRLVSLFVSFFRIRIKPDVVVVHGIHSPYLLFSLFLKCLGSKIIVVVTDPIAVILDDDGVFSRFLKRLDGKFIFFLLKFFDGAVILSERMRSYLPVSRCLAIQAIVDMPEVVGPVAWVREGSEAFRVVYGGSLEEIYGVGKIVELASRLEGKGVTIDVYGSGSLQNCIEDAAKKIDSLNYHGYLPREQFVEELSDFDLLINPRVVDDEISSLSFPSKLVEAVSLGVPVLTTPIPSLSENFLDAFFVTKSDSIDDIIEKIFEVHNLDCNAIYEHSLRARRIVYEQFSIDAVSLKLAKFIKGLN